MQLKQIMMTQKKKYYTIREPDKLLEYINDNLTPKETESIPTSYSSLVILVPIKDFKIITNIKVIQKENKAIFFLATLLNNLSEASTLEPHYR